jgi:hypothetical protein
MSAATSRDAKSNDADIGPALSVFGKYEKVTKLSGEELTQRASEVIDAARRLLALRSIDDHKLTKSQLTEDQLKDLVGRLKEAEARLPAALTTAYRHVLVPDTNKTIRSCEMGISVGRATLSQKVLDKLKDEQQILEKLDPAILIGERFGLWPQDQETVNVRTLCDVIG